MGSLLVSALITAALLGGVALLAAPLFRVVVGEAERLVVFRRGEVHRVVGPGPAWHVPGLEALLRVSIRPESRTLEGGSLQALNGAWMGAVLRVGYVVLQPERVAEVLRHPRVGPAVERLVETALGPAVAALPPERLIGADDRRNLGRGLKKAVNETALGWGIDITSIEVLEVRELAGPGEGDQGVWQVMLLAAGTDRLAVIQAVTRLTDLGLLEARDLVESLPAPLPLAGDAERAEACREALEAAGATIALLRVRADVAEPLPTGEVVDVVLQAAGPHVIEVIKVLRRVTGWDLGHARAVVDQTPYAIMHRVRRGDAEEVRRALETVGASVELV